MKIKYSIIFLFFICYVNGQVNLDPLTVGVSQGSHRIQLSKIDLSIKGNPYLNDGLSPFTIEGANSNVKLLRYNHYSDEMEYLNENVSYDLDKLQNMIITFINSNKKFIYIEHYKLEDGNLESGFLQILSEGKNINLYKKEKVILKEILQKEDIMDVGTLTKEYTSDKPIYFMNFKNDIILIPNKKKEFINFFKDDKIKAYINKEKINSTNESDLIKLTKFINK